MMTEQATLTPTLIERNGPWPSDPDEVADHEKDDGDSIKRSTTDVYEGASEPQPLVWPTKLSEMTAENAIESELHSFNAFLDLKVTDMLAVQLLTTGKVDINSVANYLQSYFEAEKTWYSENQNLSAKLIDKTSDDEELDRLDLRFKMQEEMALQVLAMQPKSETGYLQLAKEYTARLWASAENMLREIQTEKETVAAEVQIVEIPTQRNRDQEIHHLTEAAQELAA